MYKLKEDGSVGEKKFSYMLPTRHLRYNGIGKLKVKGWKSFGIWD